MKISLVIPTYTITKELEELAIRACLSYREQVDELIISEDGGFESNNLKQLADIYIYNKNNRGFTANLNCGWRVAVGDFVMLVNSDTTLHQGKLEDICIPNRVTSPEIVSQYIPYLAGPFFCVPKEITKERGYLMEEMKTYSSDSEYDTRVRDVFQKVPSVRIYHEMMQTVKAVGIEGGIEQERDRQIYAKLIEGGKAK